MHYRQTKKIKINREQTQEMCQYLSTCSQVDWVCESTTLLHLVKYHTLQLRDKLFMKWYEIQTKEKINVSLKLTAAEAYTLSFLFKNRAVPPYLKGVERLVLHGLTP